MLPRGLAVALGLAVPALLAAQNANVAEVQVAPPSVTLKIGERTGLLATAFDRIGNVIPTARISWASNNVQVARVDNNGTVTGVAAGVAIIEARAGTRKGSVAVQVTGGAGGATPPSSPTTPPAEPAGGAAPPPAGAPGVSPFAFQPAGSGPAAALRIEPPSIYLLPSEHVRAAPRALRDDGGPAAPLPVTWRSLVPDVASVDENGNVVALKEGQGTIQANAPGGLTATAPVVVQQTDLGIYERGPLTMSPGQLDTLHVVVPAQNNRPVSPLLLQWSSSNPEVVRVALSGVVTAVGSGRATIGVTGLLQTRGLEINVHRPVELLAVLPPSSREVQLPMQATQRFEVRALAADNSPVPEAPLAWRLTDSTVATLDRATGVVTGRAAGRTQLVVTGPGAGLSVTWTINIVAGSVKLSSARLGLPPGRRATIRASFADSAGTVIGPATGMTWSSNAPHVATVGEDGTVTAVNYGRARVTATAPGGRTALADVFVQGEILVSSNRSGRFELYALERTNLAALRKVSADTGSVQEPAVSPDGSRIAFVSTRDGNPEIYVMNTDGSEWRRLTTDPGADGHPVFTPDGQAVVFHSARPARRQQLYIVHVDGTGLRALTADSAGSQPTVSPDGNTIAFVAARNQDYDIWLMNRDGTNQRPFTRGPQTRETQPRFLRDGSLAYLLERRDGNRTITQIMKADLATGQTTPLTGPELMVVGYAVAPAGDLVALVMPPAGQERRRNPAYKVYIRPMGSGSPVAIPTSANEQMVTPTFLP
jgi:TolB protein